MDHILGSVYVYGNQKLSDVYITNDLRKHGDTDISTDDLLEYRKIVLNEMESNMELMNNVWESHGYNVSNIEGSGAAGGIGAGLMVYMNAKLQSGFDMCAEYADLDTKLKGANMVITGEGSIDISTAHGKVPIGVAKYAKKNGINSIICVAGNVITNTANESTKIDINDDIAEIIPFPITNKPMNLEDSMKNGDILITDTIQRICRLYDHNLHNKLHD